MNHDRILTAALSSLALVTLAGLDPAARADDDLAGHFGFDGLEVVKIDPKAGPILVVDLNDDGLEDLLAVNNSKSRIEFQYQKAGAKPTDEITAPTRVNELPEHWRFRRENVSVPHQVTGLVAYDWSGDGLVDLIYAGQPGTIGFVRQVKPGVFEVERKMPVKNLVPSRDAFAVADVIGDAKPEVIAIAGGKILVHPLEGSTLGDPVELGSGGDQIVAFLVEDFDGDGTADLAGIVPESPTPVRIWTAVNDGGRKSLGSELRFEQPPLREATSVRLPGRKAALLATIERPSRRLAIHELVAKPVESSGTREAPLSIWNFEDSGNRKRSVAVADADGDGLLDVLATNVADNAISSYRQTKGRGLGAVERFPAYADLDSLVAGDPDRDGKTEVFLLSEKEGVVGRTEWDGSGFPFPQAVALPSGQVPVVQALVELDEGPRLAAVTKDGRNYQLSLVPLDGGAAADPVKLGSLSKQPDAIVALDADRDGNVDLLLLTADKPMTMLRAGKDGYTLLESKDMGQFGLVQAANGKNVATLDIDGDGVRELLVADRNFVRALRYDEKPAGGASPGWQVVTQLNADRGDAKLVSLAVLPGQSGGAERLVAADRENSQLILFERLPGDGARWKQTDVLTVSGFKFNDLRAGAFSGDGTVDLLAIGDEGFAVVRLAGERLDLVEVAAWRSEEQRRVHHEIVTGDVNSDGFTDLVLLDAGEQMAEVLTISESGRLLYGTGFKIFESKMFSGGEPREFEPSMGVVADVTGDGADDLLLLAHDRVLLYPQATEATARKQP
jgi:hypothetical protein